MAAVVDTDTYTQIQGQIQQLQEQVDNYTSLLTVAQKQLAAWTAVLADAVHGDPITQTPEAELQPE
jgi:hypothetical protein